MRRWNNITVEAYSSGTTPVVDPKKELSRHSGLSFRTIYPGGLCADASFFVPRDIRDWWELKGAQRVVLRNYLTQVYEGYISNFGRQIGGGQQGNLVRLNGPWGMKLMKWGIRKRWADTRITDDVWEWQNGETLSEKVFLDRNQRLRFTPKSESCGLNTQARIKYTSPTGQTVKRVTCSYDLQEGAQAWEGRIITNGGESAVSRTTSGTGTLDHTFTTPDQVVFIDFISRAAQTPASDGSIYWEVSNLTLYSETGSINMEEIAKDIVGIVTDLNSGTGLITAAGTPLSLVPFIADDFETAADILNRAVSQGDGAYNRWAAQLLPSEWRAYQPDGKPLLAVEQYPAITDYEYGVRMDERNLSGQIDIDEDFNEIANWMVVSYTDLEGKLQYRTPDDTAALKDDTSISDYGRMLGRLTVPGVSTSAIADAIGQRYLATYKDPQYRLVSPITVRGYIRGKVGNLHASSEIRAGHRVRVDDYVPSTGGGPGVTFGITQTLYEDDGETCQITTGIPEAPLMLRFVPEGVGGRTGSGDHNPYDSATGSGASSGGRTITGRMLRRMGLSRAQWNRMSVRERRARRRRAGV